LLPVVQDLERRGWVNKRWTTRKGRERGGQPFERTSLYRLLTNVAYIGKVRYKDEVHDGEHSGIVEPAVFQRVQSLLQRNGQTRGAPVRNKFGALLKGLLRCVPCGCAMTPSHTTRNGTKRYRYYVCSSAQKRGWDTCPSKSIPAAQIEEFVVGQIKCVGQDQALLREVLAQAHQQDEARTSELEAEQRSLEKDLAGWHAELHKLSGQLRPGDDNGSIISRLADLQERIGLVEGRMRKVREQIQTVQQQLLDEEETAVAMSVFDPVWEALTPREQARVVGLLVERVDYDGADGKVSITFHPTGIKALAQQLADQRRERSP
jgi:site-specific DNA recombinase